MNESDTVGTEKGSLTPLHSVLACELTKWATINRCATTAISSALSTELPLSDHTIKKWSIRQTLFTLPSWSNSALKMDTRKPKHLSKKENICGQLEFTIHLCWDVYSLA